MNARNLGRRLRIARVSAAASRRLAGREVRAANAALDAYLIRSGRHLVRRFFRVVRVDIVHGLRAGQSWPGVKLGDGANRMICKLLRIDEWHDPRHRIDRADHIYNAEWMSFLKWATAQGLRPRFEYGLNGLGIDMRYWYTLRL